MKVFSFNHFIFMNENTIGIPSTVKANHIARELTGEGLGGITHSSAREPRLIHSKQIWEMASQCGVTAPERDGGT